MNVEIQLRLSVLEQKIATLVEQRAVGSGRLSLAGIYPLPFDFPSPDTEPGVVDHLSLAEASLRPEGVAAREPFTVDTPAGGEPASIDVARRSARCVFDLFCVPLETLVANGAEPTPVEEMKRFQALARLSLPQPQITESLELRIQPTLQSIELGADGIFSSIEDLPVPEEVKARLGALVDRLRTEVTLPPIVFPLTGIAGLLGRSSKPWNAGWRVTREAVVIRIQFDPPEIDADDAAEVSAAWNAGWRDFFQRPLPNRLHDGDWALFLPKEVFFARIGDTLPAAFAGRRDVVITHGPWSEWSVAGGEGADPAAHCRPGGEGRLQTVFVLAALGACKPWDMNIDATVRLDMRLSLPERRTLRIDLQYSFEVDHWDAFACSFLNSFLASLALFVVGGALGGWVGAAVGGVAGSLLGGFLTLGGVYGYQPPPISAEDLHPVEGVENAYYTEVTLPTVRSRFFGALAPRELLPCEDGIALVGSLPRGQNRRSLLGAVELPDRYAWIPLEPRCPTPPWPTQLIGRGLLRWERPFGSSNLPVVYWGHQIRDSVPGDYEENVTMERRMRTHGIVLELRHTIDELSRLRRSAASEGAETLSLTLLLQTNAGARILTVPGPGAELDEESLQRERDWIQRQCQARRQALEYFAEVARRLEPVIPIPDLPFGFGPPDAHLWSLTLIGMRLAESLQIGLAPESGAFRMLESIPASATGLTRVSFWQSTAGGRDDTALKIEGRRFWGFKRRSARGMAIHLERYNRVAAVALEGGYRDHSMLRRDGVWTLATASSRGVEVREFRRSDQVETVDYLSDDTLERVEVFAAGVAAWGSSGLWWRGRRGSWTRVAEGPVGEVFWHRGRLVAMSLSGCLFAMLPWRRCLVIDPRKLPAEASSGLRAPARREYRWAPKLMKASERRIVTPSFSPPFRRARGLAAVLSPDRQSLELMELISSGSVDPGVDSTPEVPREGGGP